ncbi:MAG: OstA-like protein, partial [Bacteroidales bacterium]|nr:OstA-like protein [Bacteroidales bacterium]
VFTQERARIEVVHADEWTYDKNKGEDITIIRGNALFKHEAAFLYCDSAYLNENQNSLDAFSNVHVIDNDTLHLWGDYLKYNGNSRLAVMQRNVKLKDPSTELYTDTLYYDRNTGSAYYTTGAEIFNGENVLNSIFGYYFTDEKLLFFKDSVELVNPDYRMYCDTLKYNTNTEVVYFQGPADIFNENNRMYCENGFYDTKGDLARFSKKVVLFYDEQILRADSLFYDNNTEYGQAFRNVIITDTSQNIEVRGQYSEYHRKEGFSFVTDSAFAMLFEDRDTLFLHADTLLTYFNDSTREAERLFAFYKAKFFRNDLQGMADSIAYSFVDSTISLFYSPVLWSEENQLTADTIFIYTSGQRIRSMRLANAAFIISVDEPSNFNQISGGEMHAWFIDNALRRVDVFGNAQTIYYLRDEENVLAGINKAESGDMKIWVEENKVVRIAYFSNPHAPLYPPEKLPEAERVLKGFQWLDQDRPADPAGIFSWRTAPEGIRHSLDAMRPDTMGADALRQKRPQP